MGGTQQPVMQLAVIKINHDLTFLKVLTHLRCFPVFLFPAGAASLAPSSSLGAGKEGEIWAELAVNSLKSFLLELKCVIMVPRTIITVN